MKRIIILGGTGSLGREFVRTCPNPERITIFSRDEQKQNDMEKDFPDCDYFLGDIRDRDRLMQALYAKDIVIHAAALKMVHKGEYDPGEFIKTNIMGTVNVARVCEMHEVPQAIYLSTDKAEEPINLYGATKLAGEKYWKAANAYNKAGVPCYSVVKYGNIMGSRGSVIPLFLHQARRGVPLTITDPRMTRFMFSLEDAVKLIWQAIETPEPGVFIPECKAMNIMEVAAACREYACKNKDQTFGLETQVVGIRPGEKLHEKLGNKTSDTVETMTREELLEWLSNYEKSQSPVVKFE